MQKQLILIVTGLVLLMAACQPIPSPENPPMLDSKFTTRQLFIGTYTPASTDNLVPEGVFLASVVPRAGQINIEKAAARLENPSFLAQTRNGHNLYAVSELGGPDVTGWVYSYSVNPNMSLSFINRVSSGGGSPCHVSLDKSDSLVFVANYTGGIVQVLKRQADGALSISQTLRLGNKAERTRSRAHSAIPSPDNQYVYIPDLGLDRIWIFKLDIEAGTLTPADDPFVALPQGAGPRHFSFHPDGEWAYVINELNNTVIAYQWHSPTGKLEALQTISTLPADFEGQSFCADIHIHPNGRFLYGSNRGHNSIVVFSIQEEFGELSLLQHVATEGDWPRNFALDPHGNFLYVANQRSGNITGFRIDSDLGTLTSLQFSVDTQTPVCLLFVNR
jgi:6-phosphogluconolactonase